MNILVFYFSLDQFFYSRQFVVVTGPGQKFLTRVGSAIYGLGLNFENFPKNVNFSIFFPSGQKNCFGLGRKVPGSKLGRPLIYCGSKVSSGQVRAHL